MVVVVASGAIYERRLFHTRRANEAIAHLYYKNRTPIAPQTIQGCPIPPNKSHEDTEERIKEQTEEREGDRERERERQNTGWGKSGQNMFRFIYIIFKRRYKSAWCSEGAGLPRCSPVS